MFLLGLSKVVYSFLCVILILLVLIQKGKGSMGLGNVGGANQMLFGSSGGQDIFQKVTRILGVILLAGSFALSVWNARIGNNRISFKKIKANTEQA